VSAADTKGISRLSEPTPVQGEAGLRPSPGLSFLDRSLRMATFELTAKNTLNGAWNPLTLTWTC
jgi:hypothetical protein